jgi:predicted nuclease of predicted toxin-antitoxin system
MKLIIDMNLSPRWVDYLSEKNIESVFWAKLGPIETEDIDILTYAEANGYIVLTNDLDFSEILRLTQKVTPSVIRLRGRDVKPECLFSQVYDALTNATSELERGAVVTIDKNKTRVTLLPIVSRRK